MAYVAATSLNEGIRFLRGASKHDTRIPKSKVEFISKELSFLGPFLKTMRLMPSNAAVDVLMESQVTDAILKLKDLIIDLFNSELSESSTDYDDGSSYLELSQRLLKARHEISLFSETLKADEEYKRREQQSYSNFTSATSDFIGKKNMVGLHDQLSRLKDLVLKQSNGIILVTGMTGIGKTALVQEIYKDPLVAECFEAYLFLSFGPRYRLKEIMLLALHQLGFDSDTFHENDSVEQLESYVKESLFGRRCLVVLDDVWDDKLGFLELLSSILPSETMLCCVIVTTQKQDLMPSYGCSYMHIRFLDDDESWNLLREMVFTSEDEQCQPQLEKIGKKIAKNCEGLPLAIIQVGELLRKIGKTVEEWEMIAEREDPLDITTEDNTPLSNALSMSYNMLPQHLKVCFLYMGVFPKKYKIARSKLVQLWASESFIEQRGFTSSEETAEEYLDELVSHCCVLSEEFRCINREKTKSCKLHFTFRSLCVSEAKREKLFHVIRKCIDCSPQNIDSQQRLCIHNNVVLAFKEVREWMELAPDVRSFLSYGPNQQYPIVLYLPFRLLKVLDILAIRFYEFPDQVLDLSELTYFAISCDGGELPPSISRLQNLEVLISRPHHNIIKSYVSYLPIEIWKLSRLKHLQCIGFDLPDPSSLDDSDSLILESLLTISGVSAHGCTPGVLARMPRLKRICTKIDSVESDFNLFGDFTPLDDKDRYNQSLKCEVMYPNLVSCQVVIPSFPMYVTKITLSGCGFPWEYMRVIGALRGLQVLKLQCNAFSGPEWIMSETEKFPNLTYLLLEDLDIQHWVINNGDQYVSTKYLVIRHCYNLQEIPRNLIVKDEIEVNYCSLSLVKLIESRRLTHEHIEVRIISAWDDDKN